MSRPFLSGYQTHTGPRGSPRDWTRAFRERMGIDAAREAVGSADPYEILGVARTASWDEVRSAYRALARQHHPDRGGDAAAFRRVQGAVELLEHRLGK